MRIPTATRSSPRRETRSLRFLAGGKERATGLRKVGRFQLCTELCGLARHADLVVPRFRPRLA
eukprot:6668962-Prymnesium_polylepis.5